MAFIVRFNDDKSQLLKATKGVSFPEVLKHISDGDLIADKPHHSRNRPNKRLYIVNINNYVWVVPYVINMEKNEIFLKTIYPNSRFTDKYLKKGEDNGK
ncbi:MAG TPA: hypothetical protein VGF75_07290 [Candidatus Saccharimonadales bacterium]|jgi:hypothetical protein